MKKITEWFPAPQRADAPGPKIIGQYDGHRIETSCVKTVIGVVNPDGSETLVVRTSSRNKSTYELDRPPTAAYNARTLSYAPECYAPFPVAALEAAGFEFTPEPEAGFYDSDIAGELVWHVNKETRRGRTVWKASAYEDRACMCRFAEAEAPTLSRARRKAIRRLESRIVADGGLRPIAAEVVDGEARLLFG
jgi:hypothetical protein